MDSKIVNLLKNGGIGIMPTDTMYGIVCDALNEQAVERLCKIRERSDHKPIITLISSIDDLFLFGIKITEQQKNILEKVWPGSVTVVLKQTIPSFEYIRRQYDSIAFRLPNPNTLIFKYLKEIGPLIAPSANPEGKNPAGDIEQARNYFGHEVDFYIDAGKLDVVPSTIIKCYQDGKCDLLREGVVDVPEFL